jgi:hypothetical protein
LIPDTLVDHIREKYPTHAREQRNQSPVSLD